MKTFVVARDFDNNTMNEGEFLSRLFLITSNLTENPMKERHQAISLHARAIIAAVVRPDPLTTGPVLEDIEPLLQQWTNKLIIYQSDDEKCTFITCLHKVLAYRTCGNPVSFDPQNFFLTYNYEGYGKNEWERQKVLISGRRT